MSTITESRTNNEIKKFLDGFWDNAYNYRQNTHFGKNAIGHYDQYRGFQIEQSRVRKGKSAIVLNCTGATIEDIVSNITDSPPTFDIIDTSKEGKFEKEAEFLEKFLSPYLWKRIKMATEVQLWVRSGLITGTGHIRTNCNVATKDIETRFLSSFSCFPAPGERRIDDMPYYIVARLIPKIILRETYGSIVDDIKKTRNLAYQFLPDMEKEAAKGLWAGIKEASRQITSGIGSMVSREDIDDDDKLLLLEYWVKDLTVDTNQITKEVKRRYPSYRYYAVVEDTLIIDDVWPYVSTGIIPYYDYITEGYWGMGEIDWMQSPQYLINKLISQVCNYMDMVANPPLKCEVGSGISENYNVRAGEKLWVKKGFFNAVDFLRVPPLPHEFLALMNTLMSVLDDITGQHRGMPVRSATQASLFAEAESQRIRTKVYNLEEGLIEWALQCKEYMEKHWIEGEVIALRDRNGNLYRERVPNIQALKQFDISIITGSTLATSRILRSQQLAVIPELDLETKLETLSWPNIDKVMQRTGVGKQLQELQTQMAQIVQENQGLRENLTKWMDYANGAKR